MSKEHSHRFAKALRPGTYGWLYEQFYKGFESLGGINIKNSHRIPKPGKKVVTGNHDRLMDPFMMGLVVPEPLFSLGKDQLSSWRYGFVGKWALAPLMNTVLITRTGRDYEILEGLAKLMLEDNIAIQSYIYGTRRPEKKKDVMPKTGVAHLAIKSSNEDSPTAVVPFGHSTSEWRPKRPIQVVVGEPIQAPLNGSELRGFALKKTRREMTEEIVGRVEELKRQAIVLDEEGAGIPGRIIWN